MIIESAAGRTYARPVFKNAQGKFDGRVFFGVMLGVGSAAGMGIKLWYSLEEAVAPFWMWAVPVVIVLIGAIGWWTHRREHADLRKHIEERAARRELIEPRDRVERPAATDERKAETGRGMPGDA